MRNRFNALCVGGTKALVGLNCKFNFKVKGH